MVQPMVQCMVQCMVSGSSHWDLHHTWVQSSENKIKADPSLDSLGLDSACPPGFRTQLHVTTSLSTGGGPVSYVYVQLSEGDFQVVDPLGLWSWFSGVVKVRFGYG